MDERCEEVRVNPSTSQVEIDLSLDDQSNNFDSNKARELNMTKQTLTTTWKPPPVTDYAVGVLFGDELHLNPVHAVAQLRPSMQYLPSKNKQAEASEESVGTSTKQEIIENKGVQASTDHKAIHEENWVSLKYHGPQSDLCSEYLKGMMANEKSSIEFDMSPEDYINSLCGGERSGSSESKATDDKLVLKVERAKYFPNELTTEIVSRLPAKSIARNRSLSTKWAALLHQTEFAKLFLKKSLLRPQLLFCVLRDGAELHVFSTPQDQNSPLVAAVQQMELPFGYGASIPCDPVLGLSCYARMVSIDGLSERRPVIVNPSTGQLLFLPKGFILWAFGCMVGFGAGFLDFWIKS